ncbi:diacylglycerol kinase family protein [Croceicoccus sp. F390]|uniref:Diacylglycerol kinase family protein n=1 Tax=Croceicoccus esteveae TaxID=3075597 RepID=A0ABU2ZHS2_9SPHN|nr:diacylglycerol kinase family protein [Croceicoccus sp. F390]MDT0576158.1 diacylglycerol kinase family protein [Croceicoccus sp. F390]
MAHDNTLWLVINKASGSHEQARMELVLGRLGEAGRMPVRTLDCHGDDMPDVAALIEAQVDTLAVHGGDGTINSVTTRLEGWHGQVLALPGGTANLLCSELYGDLGIETILDHFAAGSLQRRRIGGVACDSGFALAEILAGPGAKWADVREDMRNHDLAAMVSNTIEAASQSIAGPMVHVTDPKLGRAEGYAAIRLAPDAHTIMVEGYVAATISDYLAQGAALLRRNFREGPHDDLNSATLVQCRADSGDTIDLMIDGEQCRGSGTMTFRHHVLDLEFLGCPH